jgi:predicted sugar kinase
MTNQEEKDFIDLRIREMELRYSISLKEFMETKIRSIEQNIEMATRVLDKRLDTMNEFRAQLKDQAGQFVTRSELNLLRQNIDSDIRMLREAKSLLDGKASAGSVYIAYILSAVGLIISILLRIIFK